MRSMNAIFGHKTPRHLVAPKFLQRLVLIDLYPVGSVRNRYFKWEHFFRVQRQRQQRYAHGKCGGRTWLARNRAQARIASKL